MFTERTLIILVCTVLLVGVTGTARAAGPPDGVVVQTDELVVIRSGNVESCAMPGADYEAFEVNGKSATYRIIGQELPAGSKYVAGKGIRRVTWEPDDGGTQVEILFVAEPEFNLVNAVDGSELRPQTPQVVAGFGFDPAPERRASPVMGSRNPGEKVEVDVHGTYDLPEMKPAKYSDALVTLNVRNVDFRDVLWYMSEIGNVSIVLDPYWADEPTGNRRPVGGGADPTPGGGGGDGGSGFRPGGDFIPTIPRSGTGRLTMNLEGVPFDTALELILISVGLVKVDIYPGSFD